MKKLIALILCALCGGSLAAEKPGKPYVYKTSAGKERQMEIYFPPNHDPAKSKVPGMILFHGGGWNGGALEQFRPACAYFASRGLVCATVEYQMLGKDAAAKLPKGTSNKRVCVTDAKSAIRWFKQHAGELGIDTSVVGYLWFNPAFSPSDKSDPEIDVLTHLKTNLVPAIVFFGDQDSWKKDWDTACTKWQVLGTKSIDLQIAPSQTHSFFNKDPWQTITLIAADRFLVKQGLLSGEPTLTAPATGEKLITSPQK